MSEEGAELMRALDKLERLEHGLLADPDLNRLRRLRIFWMRKGLSARFRDVGWRRSPFSDVDWVVLEQDDELRRLLFRHLRRMVPEFADAMDRGIDL